MDKLTIITVAIISIALLWMNVLALLCAYLDPELRPTQKLSQSIFIILVPIFGAVIVLKVVNDHAPGVIERFYIPWPLRSLVLDKPLSNYGIANNNESATGVPGETNKVSNSDSFSGSDGGGGGE